MAAPGGVGLARTINVSLTVFSPRLTFSTKEATVEIPPSTGRASATFNLTNTGGSQLSWTAASQISWLKVSPASGVAPAQLQLSANLNGYGPGSYRGNVVVKSPGATGSPAILALTAVLRSKIFSILQVSPPARLDFSMIGGAAAPSPQSLGINNSTLTAAAWSAQANQNWIALSASSGTMPSQLSVSINPAGLPPGTYQGAVQVSATNHTGSPASIPVQLTITQPTLQVTPASGLSFSITLTSPSAVPQSLSVTNSTALATGWTAQADQNWIVLSAASGTMPSQLSVSVNPAALVVGTYQGKVQITSVSLPGSPASIPVTFTVTPPPGFFASPTGSPAGSGTFTDPWDLATALSQPPAVNPGATIWLRGGTYNGHFQSKLVGASDNPIIVRQYPGERATIDTGTSNSGAGIVANGSDTWFWGFEVMSSNPNRYTTTPGSFGLADRVDGIDASGARNRFINLIIHDTAQGFGFWTPAVDSEIYGCLIYYNGWQGPDRGHGHGIYTQNQNGVKLIQENIQHYGFGMGVHAYGTSNAFVQDIHFAGNVSYNSGYLAGGPLNHWSNYLITVGDGASGIVFDENHSYHNTNDGTGYAQLGWSFSGTEKDLIARNNYFVGGQSAVELWNWNQLTFTGNTIYDKDKLLSTLNLTSAQSTSGYTFDQNTYYGRPLLRYQGANLAWSNWHSTTGLDDNSTFTPGRPTGVWSFVRPNKYEAGRANIIIYNWDLNPSVTVKVPPEVQLKVGHQYEVRDAMDFFGSPVASGVFNGLDIVIPMTGLTVAPPVGQVPFAPVHTAPEFSTFVLLSK